MVALTVAVQRWGRDPVWRGRILEAEPVRLRLAIPWYRQSLFDQALDVVIQLIDRCLWPGRTPQRGRQWHAWLDRRQGISASGSVIHYAIDGCSGDAGRRPGGWAGAQHTAFHRGRGTTRYALRHPARLRPDRLGVNAERFDLALTGQTSAIANTLAGTSSRQTKRSGAKAYPWPTRG